MSPKQADPTVRAALIEAAARLLAEEGPSSLTTRRLAMEVGTSTMAVYTYFTGMDELRHAVRVEGFDRLAGYLARVDPDPEDPLLELGLVGGAYLTNAFVNPHLYRFMFMEKPSDEDPAVGLSTFERLVESVARCVEAGLFRGDSWSLAQQLWAGVHGVVTLTLTGFFTRDEALGTSFQMLINSCVAFGADRDRVLDSVSRLRLDLPEQIVA